MNEYMTGLLLVILSSIIWGISPVLIGRYRDKISEIVFTGFRSLFSMIVLFTVILFINRFEIIFSLDWIIIVFLSAVLGPFIGAVLYIKTIKLIGSGNAVTISYLYMFFAQIFSALFLGEKISLNLCIGSFIALLGIYIVYIGEQDTMNLEGVIYGLITALSWGTASMILKIALYRADSLLIALFRNMFTAILLSPIMLREYRKIFIDKGVFFTAIFTGSLGLGIGMWFFILAIEKIGVSLTVLITSISPILTRILSTYISRENPSRKAYIGTVFTSLGIIIGISNIT